MVKPLGYVPGLDGLRAFAISLVMLAHADFQLFENGGVGVPVFFALSGFLITTLLLEEYQKYGRIFFKAFYIRRTLRLFPALYAMLFCTLLYGLVVNSEMLDLIVSEIISAGLYVYNIAWIWEIEHLMLYHTWSLGVEEQFYLIWPGLLFVFIKWNTLDRASIILLALILLLFANNFGMLSNSRIIAIIHSVINESIFLGCLVAILRWRGLLKFKIPIVVAFISVLAIFMIGMLPQKFFGTIQPKSLASIFTVIIILFLIERPKDFLSQIFTNRVSILFGKISYGLYLWHLPIFKIFEFHSTLPSKVSFISKFIVSFLVALISFYFFERRATNFGRRLSDYLVTQRNKS